MSIMSISDNHEVHAEKKQGFGWIKLLLTVAVAILIGVLSTPGMYPNDAPPIYRLPIFAGMVALILFLSAGRTGVFSKRKLVMLLLWAGFGAMFLISGLLHEDDILAILWMSLGVPYLLFCVFPRAAGRHGNVMVLAAMALAFVPYIAASLILYPLTNPYAGVFSNSNAFGMATVTISAALFALLRGAIQSGGKNFLHWSWIGLLWLAVGAAFPLIILSNSRTSLITYVILGLIFVWSLLLDKYKNRWWLVFTAIAILGALSLFLVSGFSNDPRFNYLGKIIEKMEIKAIAGDVSGGRFMIWQTVMNDIEWFGRGSYSFIQNYGAAAHNTYIMILGSAGVMALVFLTVFHGMTVFLAYRRAVDNIRNDGYAIGPLMVVMNYIVLGLAELVFGVLGNGINMSFLLMAGILVNEGLAEDNSTEYAGNESMATVPFLAKGDPG